MLEEKLIIELCKKGESSAFEFLYKKYAPSMRFVCLRYAKTTFEVEDIFQEAFMKIFTNIKTYNDNGSFEGWMKRICINTAIDYYRKRADNITDYLDYLNHDAAVEEDDEDGMIKKMAEVLTQEKILEFIALLPEGYRMVFNLFIIEGYGHKEIGELLGITEGSSKSQLMKAKRYLRNKITLFLEQKKKESLLSVIKKNTKIFFN